MPLALAAIETRINADNPITTVEHGLYHFEYRAYPTIALREALFNALSTWTLRLVSPVLVKQYPRRLEITNPGGLVGGITAANILHHPPLARNPATGAGASQAAPSQPKQPRDRPHVRVHAGRRERTAADHR